MKSYFEYHELPFQYKQIQQSTGKYELAEYCDCGASHETYKQLMNICMDDKLNNIGMKNTYLSKNNLLKGLWQGISDAGAWLYDKISGFFGGVVDKIKKFFGIASPSKLFRDQIGKNLALGIGEGFSSEMGRISKEMKDAIPLNDLLSIGDISLPKRSTISYLSGIQASSGSKSSIAQNNDFKFDKLVDITFTGDINQDTLPKIEKMLKDIPGMVTKSLNEKLSMRGIKGSALQTSF